MAHAALGGTTVTGREIARERPRIGPEMRVTLHFSLLLESGEEVDTTRRGRPATFVVGDGSLPPGFERALAGLAKGDDATLDIAPADGFGERTDANVRRLARNRFSGDISLEKGLVVSFAAADGELPGVIVDLDGDDVVVDFNHPLAGRRLKFDVSVLDVRPR
jgi:FKBP-type peptidyl-prolyl cis-trans isomerase SlpA